MPSLFLPSKTFQAYQIFAANTNVGKTIFSTGLCRVASMKSNVTYLKPVQTGYPTDSDERHVKAYNSSRLLKTNTIFAYPDPVSPHIATDKPPHDDLVLSKIKNEMLNHVRQNPQNSYLFLETAGGIHSPIMSGTSQVDFYRPFRLPTILVGDSQLGGISTTLTSFESLRLRGYDIPAVLLFNQERYRNQTVIQSHISKLTPDCLVATVPAPPTPHPSQDHQAMTAYYEQLDQHLQPILTHLDQQHQARFERLDQMASRSRSSFWWPFTQHGLVQDVTVIDSAHQDHFTTYRDQKPHQMFDACASWWTQGLGHANPDLTLSAAYAAGRYGHVIFPEATHAPALDLAETVLDHDRWAQRVFFSDNGSTAMEVALKMAITATTRRYDLGRSVTVLGIDGSYHGDTIGAMDACSPNVYNAQVPWYSPRGHWLKPPTVHVVKGKPEVRLPDEIQHGSRVVMFDRLSEVYREELDLSSGLAESYRAYVRKELKALKEAGHQLGALLMEPVLMGAGGMIFVDPLFQRVLIDVVRQEGSELLFDQKEKFEGWQGLPIVFDEVFAGWYRLGKRSASEFLGVTPDITAYAKTLTGGLLPLALTVTKEEIYENFVTKNKPDCLLHGHSYTAHPMGCAVAKTSIETLNRLNKEEWNNFKDNWKDSTIWSMWTPEVIDKLSKLDKVEGVMTLGSVLAVELKDNEKGYGSSISSLIIKKLKTGNPKDEAGIQLFARPLGNVIYLMTSQITTKERVHQCEQALLETLL